MFTYVMNVGIGEIFRRLIAKCILAMEACGNLNLCAGLPAGIEGAVHAMTTSWENAMATEAAHWPALTTQLPEEAASLEEAPMEPVELEDVHVALMVDATKGFNELGCKAMLWTVQHEKEKKDKYLEDCLDAFFQLESIVPGPVRIRSIPARSSPSLYHSSMQILCPLQHYNNTTKTRK